MSKIKKTGEETSINIYTTFLKDEGMYTIQASIYSLVSEENTLACYDIQGIELEFFINKRKVKYTGFVALYEQLYGEGTFNDFLIKKESEFEEAYLKTTPY
jgi:hypothetical protein